MEPCCILRDEPFRNGQVIFENSNFFICASLGAMKIPGYVLIVPKEHFDGTGDMPDELLPEMGELVTMARRKLHEVYGRPPIVFEHGPRVGMCGWGGCIDHTHLHLVTGVDITRPFAVDLLEKLEEGKQFYRVDRAQGIDAFRRTADIFRAGKTSYLVYESPDARRFVAEVNYPGQSQWMRKLVAEQVGTPDWNWRLKPDLETFRRTVETLQGKFKL
jgi:diadenosine tetraphosphate (Ap4A) HIT family hydrolase